MIVGDNSEMRDPMRVLVAGAGGMLGTDGRRARRAAGHEVIALSRGPTSTSPAGRPSRTRSRRSAPTRWSTAPPTPTSTEPRTTRRPRCSSTTTARRCSSTRGGRARREDPLRLQRLRLRRQQARALRRIGRDRADLGLRALQAGRRDLGRDRQPPSPASSARPGSSAPTGRTSSRRCCASRASSPRCSSSPTRSAAPTYTRHLADGLALLLESEDYGIHHIAAAGSCSWYEFAQEIFDQEGVECRVMAGTTEMLARPAPRPARSVLGSERRDADRAAALAARPERVPRASAG